MFRNVVLNSCKITQVRSVLERNKSNCRETRRCIKHTGKSEQDAECTCLCTPEQGQGALLPFPRAPFGVVCVNQQGTVLFRKEQDFPFT